MKRRLIIAAVIAIAAVAVTVVYAGWFSKDAGLQGSGDGGGAKYPRRLKGEVGRILQVPSAKAIAFSRDKP